MFNVVAIAGDGIGAIEFVHSFTQILMCFCVVDEASRHRHRDRRLIRGMKLNVF